MTSKTLLDLVELDSLPQSWEVRKLEDVASINQETTNLKNYSWIHYTDISSVGTRTVEIPSKLETKDAPGRARRVLRKGDTVISSVRPNRRSFFYFNEEWTNAIASTGFAVLSPKNFDDAEYLHAVLTSENAVKIYEAICEGGAYPAFNPSRLNEIRIPWPPHSVRRELGHVVMNLQSKIALNNAFSKTLEGIAQTIFKSWFIDFDPVKAKMVGQKPAGMDAATAALFPDLMEESELGFVPKGWTVVPSTDFFEVLSGGTPKTSNEEYWNGDIPWFSVVDAPDSEGCFFIKTSKTITKEGLTNSAAKLVRPGVTVISARGTVGKTAIVAIPSTFNQSCYGIEGKFGDFFTYLLLRNQVVRLQNISHGGMFDTITRETFSAIKVAKPKPELVSIFESIVSPIFLEIRNLQFQSNELACIRDSLLPRLISGELQIPDEMLAS
jgi:type I restriction enzyme S subunit